MRRLEKRRGEVEDTKNCKFEDFVGDYVVGGVCVILEASQRRVWSYADFRSAVLNCCSGQL